MSFRTSFAVALAALLAFPLAASAQARKSGGSRASASAGTSSSSSGSKALSIGGMVGLELGTLDGFGLRVDGEMPIQPLAPKVSLSGLGSIGIARLSKNIAGGDVTWTTFSVIPAARFKTPVAPEIDLYGDAGLGLYYGSWSSSWNFGPFHFSDSGTTTGFLMRFAVGAQYKLNPKTRLSAEIGVIPYFGDADTTNVTLAVGAMFNI